MSRTVTLEALMVTAGRVAFVALWFVAIMLVYNGLARRPDGLAQAGIFAISIACVKVASGCISDPIDLALMGRVPPMLRVAPSKAFEVLRAAFGLRLAAALAVAAVMMVAAPVVLDHPDARSVMQYVAAAIVGDILFRAVLVVLQASERFRAFVLLEGLLHVGRFAAITVMWSADAMRVDLALAAYAVVSFAAAIVGVMLLPTGLIGSLRTGWHHVIDLVQYLKWMVPAMLLAAINERLDVFFVYSIKGSDSAGLYGAVLTLALIPDILGGCLSTILQPRIVRMRESGEFAWNMRRFLMLSVPVCGVALGAALLLADPVIPLVLGAKYAPAIPAFRWLLAGTLFWLAVTPLPMTLVAVLAPDRIVFVTLGQSCIVLFGGFMLLPALGLLGMAQAVFAMRVVIALTLVAVARGMTRATPRIETA